MTTNYTNEIVDGQQLYFLTKQEWLDLLESGTFMEETIPQRLLKKIKDIDLPFANRHEDLVLGLGIMGMKNNVFSYPLYKVGNRYQRISLERVICSSCGWKGRAGSPLVSEIYFGVPKNVLLKSIMDRARVEFPEVSCPKCSSPFDRFFIWVENQE
jgi:hypothetical protein